ncbi:MAG: TrkH family potassium uptake protein [Gammaproteobacteria bacterium]|nr:TrkH family potassium uptake protein [Gammaproteobacteria bacterium]
MQRTVIQRILGQLLMLFSITMLPPLLVGMYYGEVDVYNSFGNSFIATLLTGFLLWLPYNKHHGDLRLRDGFIIVVLFWTVLGAFGSLPLLLSDAIHISVVDGLFESISGLTTTGATVLTELNTLPYSILFYRQQLQWLGGMGIIVLAVAILPMLGVGGMQLYRAETPGPVKDSKLTPRITETAKALWYIYLSLTVACAFTYWAAGMSVFDAISHSFSTIAIGGFSTHDQNIQYFNSTAIEWVAIVFMLASGANFGLHFIVWRNRSMLYYWRDAEFKMYISTLTLVSVGTFFILYMHHANPQWLALATKSIFQVVSMGTTTGFTSTDFSVWPTLLPVLLIMISFIGGCAGSTGGGMKVIRILLLFKQGMREIMRLIHPNAQFAVKLGKKPVENRIIEAVWGFLSAYIAVFIVMLLLLLATGLDQVTAYSAVAATLNNLGPGLGEVANNYSTINDFSKIVLCLGMLLGRLEIFTLLVIFTPVFWRR